MLVAPVKGWRGVVDTWLPSHALCQPAVALLCWTALLLARTAWTVLHWPGTTTGVGEARHDEGPWLAAWVPGAPTCWPLLPRCCWLLVWPCVGSGPALHPTSQAAPQLLLLLGTQCTTIRRVWGGATGQPTGAAHCFCAAGPTLRMSLPTWLLLLLLTMPPGSRDTPCAGCMPPTNGPIAGLACRAPVLGTLARCLNYVRHTQADLQAAQREPICHPPLRAVADVADAADHM